MEKILSEPVRGDIQPISVAFDDVYSNLAQWDLNLALLNEIERRVLSVGTARSFTSRPIRIQDASPNLPPPLLTQADASQHL